ncbi:Outer membrane protein TolC [Variovorax sp. OK605]|jgi:outer membrane protein TolC|uniref:TolC family protein n=1 Tax=unclassified Variovorax TaxID=663243 RepID=UPI0008BF9BE0|nr:MULTISPECIES: TolC family protein [unclassified Variovorax]SEK11120.1 Outer membrane protein TolC [Variovorax sp. OK202]SFD72638.1 Outer membrane protein TolC [Variovorax sp. OK212]SFP95602.1 Outer membrane protein TolC [Variovorax sp. OK605]
MKYRTSLDRRRIGPGVVCAALCASFALSPTAFAQLQADAQELQQPGPSLMLARRLSPPSLGAASYAAQVKQALIVLSQDYPEVQTAQAAANTSGYGVDAAKQARYPRFKLGTSSGNYNSGEKGAKTQSYTVLTAEARMSLLDGGALSAAQRAAEAGSQADDEAVVTTSQKVVLDALTAYLQVQRFDLKKQIAHRATEVVAELSKAEARRVQLGVTGDNDLNMAASRRALVAARESDFAAQRDEAIAKFRNYFKFTPNAESLPVLAAPPQWRIASQDEALRRAEARSTEIAEAQGRIERARALADQQDASLYPTLDAVVVKSKDPRGVSPQDPTRAALELNWNFGNGFDRQLRLRTALAEVANQEAKLEGVKLNLFELTSASWSRTVSGRERERQLMEAVSTAGQAFRGRRRLMEFGRETLPNVLDAQLDYYTLLFDYIDGVFDLRISELRLARTTGELRIDPASPNGWIDRLFGAPSRQVLTEDGLLGALCISSNTACASEPVAERTVGPAGAAPALRRTPRLSTP